MGFLKKMNIIIMVKAKTKNDQFLAIKLDFLIPC